jgi:hypothetical protein
MLNISYIVPLICFWNTLTNEISKYKQLDVSNNIISLIHCLLFMVHHDNHYNVEYAVHMSIGYYIYDLIYIISSLYKSKSKDEFNRRYPFIIHHFIGLYLLNACISDTGESNFHLLYGYNILEKSNIMLYVSYHLHKEYASYFHLNIISEFFQVLWYFYYRIIKLSSFTFNNKTHFFHFRYPTQVVIIILYFMGIVWSYKLIKKNIKNFNMIKRLYISKYNSEYNK